MGWVPSMTTQGHPLLALSHHPEPTHREVLPILPSEGTQNPRPQPAPAPSHQPPHLHRDSSCSLAFPLLPWCFRQHPVSSRHREHFSTKITTGHFRTVSPPTPPIIRRINPKSQLWPAGPAHCSHLSECSSTSPPCSLPQAQPPAAPLPQGLCTGCVLHQNTPLPSPVR